MTITKPRSAIAHTKPRSVIAPRTTRSRKPRSPRRPGDPHDRLTHVVLEEIRRVAKERANGMTLDSPIVETGMDSLERMEIVASLEERFGGRFPEDVLVELETARHVVAAVEKYLGRQPRQDGSTPRRGEIPPAAYRFELFPEYLQASRRVSTCWSPPASETPSSPSTTACVGT